MAIVINGNGIDMGNNPVSNASQIDGVVINEDNENVATTSNLVGFKNYIINGNFDIWQRGTSQTYNGYGSDDRWTNGNVGSIKTHSQVACTDTERALFNANYFSRTVVNSVPGGSNYVIKVQRIEDITKLAGKTVTVSFWAKADGNKNIALEFEESFGTGGTPSASIYGIGTQKISLTTTWKKFSLVFNIPSIIGKTLGIDGVHTSSTSLYFWFDAGSDFNFRTNSLGQQSGTFDIAQVQLEEGSVATPFEQRPIGLELSLCQRYYRKSFTLNVTPSNAGSADSINDIRNAITAFAPHRGKLVSSINTCSIPFGVEMRVAPTIQRYGNSSGYWFYNDGITAEFTHNMFVLATTKGLVIDNEISTAFNVLVVGHYTADAEL